MSQKLPVDGFEWVEDVPSLNQKHRIFIKFVKKI